MNNGDLSHINRQIQKNQVEIEAKRRQADSYRLISDQKHSTGSADGDYYEQEADKLETEADEQEVENNQLQTEKERREKRIASLEEQKANIGQENAERLRRIDQEIASLRGSELML